VSNVTTAPIDIWRVKEEFPFIVLLLVLGDGAEVSWTVRVTAGHAFIRRPR
jgi:hypothetical protein